MAKIKLSVDRHGRPTASAQVHTDKGLRPLTAKQLQPVKAATDIGAEWQQLVFELFEQKAAGQDTSGKGRTEI